MNSRDVARKMARSAFERLPDSVREDVKRRRGEMSGLGQLKDNQALLALRLAELERIVDPPAPVTDVVPDGRFPDAVRSRLCTSAQFAEPWFDEWCQAMNEPNVAHRKVWEFTYIAHVLDTMGMLEPGKRGLGFGVGREPLISAFAHRGVEVLATDLEPTSSEALGWVRSDQHAHTVEDMLRPGVCDPDQFRKLVSWRAVDMRNIPADIQGYDFCWSACAFEHLGSLAEGLDFVENSVAALRPGGIAVHTTEFNVESDDETIESGPTVIYRKRDLRAFKERMEAKGHEVAAFDFSRGEGLLDKYVDVPPYKEEPVLRFWYAQHVLTSVAVVVRAAPGRV
ncbi:MAG TPA: class I SAM-dependent methyltransferase [Nocardioidaceae bacterium]|nr:class I SAM-dependent methyltransferase [Nocardioidaceae bacterium]